MDTLTSEGSAEFLTAATSNEQLTADGIEQIVQVNSSNLMDAYFAIREVNTESAVLKAMIQEFLQSEKYSSLDSVVDDILYELEDMLQELRYSVEDAVLDIRLEKDKLNNQM